MGWGECDHRWFGCVEVVRRMFVYERWCLASCICGIVYLDAWNGSEKIILATFRLYQKRKISSEPFYQPIADTLDAET